MFCFIDIACLVCSVSVLYICELLELAFPASSWFGKNVLCTLTVLQSPLLHLFNPTYSL